MTVDLTTIDQQINQFFAPFAQAVFSVVLYKIPVLGADVPLVVFALAFAAVYFTFYLNGVNFRYFAHGWDVAMGKFDKSKDDGEISSFQAMMASLSGTVGLGNVAGVALAISIGGAGAAFWMFMMGLFGMASKFAEVTLGCKYRRHASAEHKEALSGGPMYYLEEGFKKKGLGWLGKILAILFAIGCTMGAIGGGNMFQANQTYQIFLNVTGGAESFLAGYGWAFGIVMAVLVGVVILGGIKSISNAASKVVPLMAVLLLACNGIIILMNLDILPDILTDISTQAFSLKAGIGGMIGVMVIGVQRAAFSNEAGLGTAAVVYSAARARHPVMQGMASMVGPFIDTVVICTSTALMILVSGALDGGVEGMQGIELTTKAYATVAPWFPYFLAASVFLLAYSTMITFAYYGSKCLGYIFGESDALTFSFNIFYCLCIILGTSVTLASLIDFTDALFLAMALPNVIGLIVLAPEVKAELKDYVKKMKL